VTRVAPATALAVSYSGLLGGAERVLLDVATGLPEPPLLACPPGPLAEAARAQGLGVFELRPRSLALRRSARDRVAMPLRIAAQAAEVRAIVAGQRPQLLIAWGMRAALVLTAAYPRGGGRPPLLFQHNDLLPGPQIAAAVRIAAARADFVTTCSECVARELDPTGALGVESVAPGVDLARFRPRAEAQPRREVLVLGVIERWKRPELALEAIALAAQRLPGLRLRLVGAPIGADGERLLGELRARAGQPDLDGRVELTGALDDPRAALAEAACLLHCADREPYGMAIAEALASGVPVVAPASCGPAEIVDEHCARCFDPGDVVAAARALEQVLGDEATTTAMGAAARARAEQRLDLEQMRRRYAEIVADLAGRHRSRKAGPPRAGAERVLGAKPSADPGAQLAIVTVIHDSEPELGQLLASIDRHLPAAQVIVVDCASGDGGPALVRAWRDGAAELIELGENAGFGRGVNAGMARVRRPLTALLNPDVELLDASLDAAAREAAAHPHRLLGPLVLLPDGRRQDNAQREPGTPLLAIHALVPGAALPRPLAALVEPWRAQGPRRAGWAVGCAVVADTDTLRRLGPFDERTFMYGEDLDLGLRATEAGIETRFWPAARVLHRGGHSTLRAYGGEPFELLAQRRRAVVAERRGRLRAAADDLLQAATFANRALLKLAARRDASRERRQLRALRRARQGRA
jgi:GT2 family glycosyltransferase/glycosyltransferase involved in cell wall biosynthesis